VARIEILNVHEIKQFINPPILNHQEKEYFFRLPKLIYDKIVLFEDKNAITIVTLLYGYFLKSNKFYYTEVFHDEDISFIIKNEDLKIDCSEKTFYRYKQIIKQYLGIKDYSNDIENILQNEANTLSSNFIHRKKIFYALVELSKKLKIEIPSYTKLIKIITNAVNTNKKAIIDKLKLYENNENLKVLDEFLEHFT